MSKEAVTLDDISRARRSIADAVRRTPLVPSFALSEEAGADVRLKLETAQDTGTFKIRGATNKLLSLGREDRARGVVAVSSGNHGRGVARAAKRLGVRAVVCMGRLVPDNKVAAIRALGAEVRIVGDSQDEAEVEARRLVREEGLVEAHPFDDARVIAGQGTIGLEILEDLPAVRTVVVPLSGGGLIAGVALAVKSIRPKVRVVGVTMERGAAMYESQKAGRPVPVDEVPTLADALGGGIGLRNRHTFSMVRDLVDELHLVDEEQIADAIRHAYWTEGQIVEGAGAVGIAALMAGLVEDPGPTAVVVSGGNIDRALHARLVAGREAPAPAMA